MSAEPAHELPVSQARSELADVVNQAVYTGRVTHLTRKGRRVGAAIVPEWLVEAYEEMLDRHDGAVAAQRLADIRAGRESTLSHQEVWSEQADLDGPPDV